MYSTQDLDTAEVQPFVHTDQEIQDWTTDDEFSEGRKALFLLNEGFVQQKSTVLAGLYQLWDSPELPAVLNLVQREIYSWAEELQEQAGLGAYRLISLLPSQGDFFLRLCLGFLPYTVPSVLSAWLAVFNASVRSVSMTTLTDYCVSEVLSLAESIPTRGIACELLPVLAAVLKEDYSGELMDRTLVLMQDPNYEIRLKMTKAVNTIVRCVQDRERLKEEIVKLVRDDQLEVQSAAVQLLGSIYHLYSDEEQVHILTPLIINELLPDPDLKPAICSVFSPFLHCCHLHSPSLLSLITYSQSIQSPDSLHLSLIPSLPTLLSLYPALDFAYIERFWTNGSPAVRSSLSKVYPNVTHIQILSIRSTNVEQGLYMQMLNSATWMTVPYVATAFPVLTYANQVQVLEVVQSVLDLKYPWRSVLTVLQQVESMLETWTVKDGLRLIQPAILDILDKGAWKLQLKSVSILGKLIEQNYYKNKRLTLCNSFLQKYGHSKDYKKRVIYISLCQELARRVSKPVFQTLFFPLLLSLAQDSVSNVRYHLSCMLPDIGRVFSSDEDWSLSVSHTMKALSEDTDRDVREAAGRGVQVRTEYEYWAASKGEEMENQFRLQREKEQERREIMERDEEKKAMLQELTRKARLDYRNTNRRSTSKASSSRTTPTRVKQRNSLSQEKAPAPVVKPFRLPRSKKKPHM